MSDERTNEELAEHLDSMVEDIPFALKHLKIFPAILSEAASRLRALDGERIEGWLPNWPATNGMPIVEFIEFHLERKTAVQGEQNVSRATLIPHRKASSE